MSAFFVGTGRAVIAGLLAAIALGVTRQNLPRGRQWLQLSIVAGGAVLGFPLLTSYALSMTSASHGAVVIAVLPAATAVVAVLRTGEHPGKRFWIAAGIGTVAAIAFAMHQNGELAGLKWPDLLLFAAVIVCAIGYAEGGVLARELGAWQTISWALVLVSPATVVFAVFSFPEQPSGDSLSEWAAMAYLSIFSAFFGFIAWYRGLSIGPMAQVSQVQLTQPVMSICWAGLLLGEEITAATVIGGLGVVACALTAVRARNQSQESPSKQGTSVPGSTKSEGAIS